MNGKTAKKLRKIAYQMNADYDTIKKLYRDGILVIKAKPANTGEHKVKSTLTDEKRG